MTGSLRRTIDVRLYRAALSACPPVFRREYAEEMTADFRDGWEEASATGARALWRFRLLMTIDLLRTVGTQWTRSQWPAILALSLLAPLALVAALASVVRHAAFVIPSETVHPDTMGVLLLATITVLLIATTIALTLWAARPVRRRRR